MIRRQCTKIEHMIITKHLIRVGLITATVLTFVVVTITHRPSTLLSSSSQLSKGIPLEDDVTKVRRRIHSSITKKKFHQSGFGGIYNQAHPYGYENKALLQEAEVSIPKSAVKHAIPSLSRQNIENIFGHYIHDEHQSPYSSFLYKRPQNELDQEQKEYEEKMSRVREEWGAWNFTDENILADDRPVANFDTIPYKDMENDLFPKDSWQTDREYVTSFISEANQLVDRMIEGIYAEYGHPTKRADGTILTPDEVETRNQLFKIHVGDDNQDNSGISSINQSGMDILTRKLLHGMITNDEFYAVITGHSAAAGHGNNFLQSKMMQFHQIMEPVFHKLGMRLVSRNLAMGSMGK